MLKRLALLATTALLLSTSAHADVMVEEAYVRAMPPGQTVTGAFMLLKNTGDEDRAVVSAESDAANVVELHTHVNDNGVMKMRQIPQIDLTAGETTELKPGGLHIMLIDVPNRLNVDDQVSIKLIFDDGSEQTFTAPVKSVTGGMMNHGGMQGGQGMPMQGSEMKTGPGTKPGMQGAMGKADNHQRMMMMRHTNPMPNYMQVVVKMGGQLNLSAEQQQALANWRKDNNAAVEALAGDIAAAEQRLSELSMSGSDSVDIELAAQAMLDKRMEMIQRKNACRDNLRQILSEDQFAQVVELYGNMI